MNTSHCTRGFSVLTFSTLVFLAGCTQATQPRQQEEQEASDQSLPVRWEMAEDGWRAVGGTPPACSEPFVLDAPVDIAQATSVLYPGQTRGGDYKPHGGFRFDQASSNAITVRAPIDGEVVQGARYLENGDVQYMLDIIHPCGMMVRFDHLLSLSPKFAEIAKRFPEARADDSRTTPVEPPVSVTAGEEIASAVGETKGGRNVFVDWGVYDLRKKNQASADSAWASSHDAQLAQHGLCWFEWLSAADETRVRALPAGDSKSGTTSDYCL